MNGGWLIELPRISNWVDKIFIGSLFAFMLLDWALSLGLSNNSSVKSVFEFFLFAFKGMNAFFLLML